MCSVTGGLNPDAKEIRGRGRVRPEGTLDRNKQNSADVPIQLTVWLRRLYETWQELVEEARVPYPINCGVG